MVSSEVTPFAKTGGLADVVGALPVALRRYHHEAAVVAPRYASVEVDSGSLVWDRLPVQLDGKVFDIAVYQPPADYPVYLLDCPELFARKGLYGEGGKDYPDNHIRFAALARGALGVARRLFHPDIFHCHDWQSGLVPAYLRTTFAADPILIGCRTLFTIHNLGYHGLFPRAALEAVDLDPSVFTPDGMEFFGKLSYIKGGIAYADALSTVSPTYAREIQTREFGFGLDGALRTRTHDLTGILNGVDYSEWDPRSDPHIAAHYTADNLDGKRVCKRALVEEFALPAEAMDRPLVGVVARFTEQKGADILSQAADQIMAEDVYLVALGTGEPKYEEFFQQMARGHPDRVAVRIGFDNPLAHRIEAGADLFLMPSRYEPSGLNQMYSLRYGTVPVVHATGGLDDTIEWGTGFKFSGYSSQALLEAVRAAVAAFTDRDAWRDRMRRGMGKDFSWDIAAGGYSELYHRLSGGV